MEDFKHLVVWAASELECHHLLAKDLDFLTDEQVEDLEATVLEVERMLASLVQRLQHPMLAGS